MGVTEHGKVLRLAAALALFSLAGCAGVRFGPFGIGAHAVSVSRSVWLSGVEWCPDSRHIIVAKQSTRESLWVFFLILPAPFAAGENWRETQCGVYLVDATGAGGARWLGEGRAPKVAPRGTFVAYTSDGGSGEPPGAYLRLTDYAVGKTWTLASRLGRYSFSPDGKWLTWDSWDSPSSAWKVVGVEQPERPHMLAATEEDFKRTDWWPQGDGYPSWARPWEWGSDGALYRTVRCAEEEQKPARRRWVRLVPPDWKVQEIGLLPWPQEVPAPVRGVRGERRWVRASTGRDARPSPDGTMWFWTDTTSWRFPYLSLILPTWGFAAGDLYVECADGTGKRRAARFLPRW